MSLFVSASSSSSNNNNEEEEVVGLNNVNNNRHRNNVTYNTRPVRSSSVPNMTQISPKRRRSFGAKIGSKMWSLLRRGSSSSSSASRARARSLATNDDSYDVEYEDNFGDNDDGNHDPSNYDGNTGYNSQNGSPFTTPELRGMVTPPQSPSSSHHFKEQEHFSLATPPQSPTKQRLSLYSLLKRSKSNSSVGGKSYITSNGSSNGNTTKAPPHTIRFMDNFYILDPNSTAILADALISNRNTSNARKILNSIGKFCSKTNIYKVFDCGIPRNTEEEDDVCPEKMKRLLNANEYNKQNILQASHNGNHLGPSWNILFKVTSDIADWLYYFGPYFTNDANISINHESNNYRNNFVKYPHKQHAIVLLGSSTVVMHTIATAYYLRMSNDPSVEESMRYTLGVMKQNTRVTPIRRLKSPKRKKNKSKSNSNITNNINKVSNGKTSNGQKMVDYVKQKLGIYSKFDKAEFLKKSRLLGDLLYAHKQERLLINMNNNSTNYVGDKNMVKYNSNNNNNNNNNKKQAWIENVNNVAPSPGTAMNMLQRSNVKSGSDDDGEEDSDTNNKKRQMLLSALPPKSRMKLRTILLHSIPHVTVTGCRPYVMIMNSKNELLFTSMIGGVRNATWLDNVISFHPNIEVDSEFQIRIYHLPNGRPGVRLFDAILRTSSCCDFKRPTNSVDSDESEDEYGSYDNDSIPLDEEDIVGHHRDIVKEHSDWGEEKKQKKIATRNTADIVVGDRIRALWKESTQRSFPGYYPGVIVRINQQNRTFAVLYDDGYMDREVKRSSIKVEGLDDGDDDGAGGNENGNVGNNTDQNNNVTFSQPPPPPPRRYSRQSSMNNNSNGNDEERTQWMSLLTEMFPSHDIFTLCKWIDHGLSSNMTLDQVVEDIVNDRILPQSAMLNENMNGDGNENGENNMYYNTSMSARLCMQTPFGEGRVERETVYEGNKFYVLKLSWGRAYINEKEVRNTRISLSPPPEIYQNFNNNNSSSNQSTARPSRSLPRPPLFAAIGNVSNNNTRLSPPRLNVERERQISADEDFARQLQNSFANANNLEMTVDDVNDMSEEALIELVLGESSTNNRNNNTNNTIEERYQSFMNNRPGNVGRDGRPRGIPAPLLMNRVSGGRIGRNRNNNNLNVHNRSSSSSSNNNSNSSNNISGNFRRKLGGASVSEITRLPKFVYVPSTKHTGTSKSCTVCMEDYKEGDSLRTLPCLHQFHANCIDEWLGYKSSCPVCKASISDC